MDPRSGTGLGIELARLEQAIAACLRPICGGTPIQEFVRLVRSVALTELKYIASGEAYERLVEEIETVARGNRPTA